MMNGRRAGWWRKYLGCWLCILLAGVTGILGGCGAERAELGTCLFARNGVIWTAPGLTEDIIEVKDEKGVYTVKPEILPGGKCWIPFLWQPGKTLVLRQGGRIWEGQAPVETGAAAVFTEELHGLDESPTIKEWTALVYEDVAVSADGKYIAVASFDRTLYVYDHSGKKKWEYPVAQGLPLCVAFSADGSRLYMGEAGPDAALYAFSVADGKILWRQVFRPDVGGTDSGRWNQRPKVRGLAVAKGCVIATAEYVQRVTVEDNGKSRVEWRTSSVLRAFQEETGMGLWRYPAEGTMDTSLSRLSVSQDGKWLAFAHHSWSRGQWYPDGSVRLMAVENGTVLASDILEPEGRYFNYVGIFDGISLSPNGQYLAVLTADNRGLLYKIEGIRAEEKKLNLLWQRQISHVQDVAGIPVYAYGNTALVDGDGNVAFLTGGTFVADKTASSGKPPLSHPDATSLFFYNERGELKWRWQSEGGIGKMRSSGTQRQWVLTLYHNYVTQSKIRAGIYMFDMDRKSEGAAWFYPVQGVAVTGAISADGKIAAGVEVPIKDLQDIPEGKHRLHVLQ